MKSDSFRNNRKALAALLLCTGCIAGHPLAVMAESNDAAMEVVQQQINVSGVVKDAMGPVIGASVVNSLKLNRTADSISAFDAPIAVSVGLPALLCDEQALPAET